MSSPAATSPPVTAPASAGGSPNALAALARLARAAGAAIRPACVPRARGADAAGAVGADVRPVGLDRLGPRDPRISTCRRPPARRGSRCRSRSRPSSRCSARRRRRCGCSSRAPGRSTACWPRSGSADGSARRQAGLPRARLLSPAAFRPEPPRRSRCCCAVVRPQRARWRTRRASRSRSRSRRSSATSRVVGGSRSRLRSGSACCARRRGAFVGLYGLWLLWRDRRALWLVAVGLVSLPLLWLVPEKWGSGDWLRAAHRAQQPVGNSAAFSQNPTVEVLADGAAMLTPPVWVGLGAARGARGCAVATAAIGAAARRAAAMDAARRGDDRQRLLGQPALPDRPRRPRDRARCRRRRQGGRAAAAADRARDGALRRRSWRRSRFRPSNRRRARRSRHDVPGAPDRRARAAGRARRRGCAAARLRPCLQRRLSRAGGRLALARAHRATSAFSPQGPPAVVFRSRTTRSSSPVPPLGRSGVGAHGRRQRPLADRRSLPMSDA